MTPAAIVTIVAAVLVVLTLAVFLIAIARVLVAIDTGLGTVIGAVGEIATRTEPVEYVVDSLNSNLGKASDLLTGLLVSKVGADGATALVASVDPLGQLTAEPGPNRMRYERASSYGAGETPEAAPASPPPPAPAGDRIQYERAHSYGAGEAAPAPGSAPPAVEPERTPATAREPEPAQHPFTGGGGGTIRFGGRST